MTTTLPRPPGGGLAISRWSAVSAFGIGAPAFRAGVSASVGASVGAGRPGSPAGEPRRVPDFDIRAVLGRKGTRTMDRVTGIAVTTVGMVLDGVALGTGAAEHLPAGPLDPPGPPPGEADEVGLVLGTGNGSVASMMDFTREGLTGAKPFYVDPARFPNTVMNYAAGQCAIWHGLTGPNTTIAGGQLTGLLALNYATRLLRAGRAEAMIVGAAEEVSDARDWLVRLAETGPRPAAGTGTGTGASRGRGPLGEGCAAFLVEPVDRARRAGRRPLARILGARFRAAGPPGAAGGPGMRAALTSRVADVLARAGRRAPEVRIVAVTGDDAERCALERGAVGDLPGADPALWLDCSALFGDTAAAAAALGLGAILAVSEAGPESAHPESEDPESEDPESAGAAADPGQLALVVSTDRDGGAGALLVATP